jgi:hypothetical protein
MICKHLSLLRVRGVTPQQPSISILPSYLVFSLHAWMQSNDEMRIATVVLTSTSDLDAKHFNKPHLYLEQKLMPSRK